MSADRWGKCPNCRLIAEGKVDALKERIAQAREDGDFDLFASLIEQKQKRRPVPLENDLRQDWELYIKGVDNNEDDYGGDVSDGATLVVDFRAQCTVCGFVYSVKFSDAQLLDPASGLRRSLTVERTGAGSWKHEETRGK